MKLTFDKIIISISALGLALAFLLFYFLWLHPMQKVIVGYSAQTACQQHFIAKRALDFTYRRELSDWTAAPVTIEGNKVTASIPYLPFYSEFSVFIPHSGCVLGWQDPKKIAAAKQKDEYDYDYEEEAAELKNYDFKTDYRPIRAQKVARRIKPQAQQIAENYVARKHLYTRAFLVARNGVIIAEAYGDGTKADTPHQGWSMTKSLLHALYGVAMQNGVLDAAGKPPVRLWRGIGDKRSTITFDELFRMHSGLSFDETYFPPSDVTKMLFTKISGGRFAAEKFLENTKDKHWHYSSGTSNILSWIYAKELTKKNLDPIGFMRDKLFQPLGMSSMVVSPDFVGTPTSSSFGFATGEDWLKLGQLYLQQGKWRGKQLVPASWVKKAATSPTHGSKGRYSHHWWLNDPESKFVRDYPSAPKDAYWAGGFNGQIVMVIPSKNIVITRLGWTIGEKTELDGVIAQLLEAL